jgi:hypothetical protein
LTTTSTDGNGPAARRRGRSRSGFRLEADLYGPVKRFLEGQGYVVKGEVRGCDVLAVRAAEGGPGEPAVVVVELKLAFTLSLVLQAVDRLAVTDLVYLALPGGGSGSAPGARRRPAFSPAHPSVRRLCRRLGLGLLAVHAAAPSSAGKAAGSRGRVEVVLDPVPRRVPRKNKARAALLLREHARRHGDPTPGGGTGGKPVVTAYRQEALRCAAFLLHRGGGGPLAVADVRHGAAAPDAARILYRNVYGWFEPAGRGRYRLTGEGAEGLATFAGRFGPPGEGCATAGTISATGAADGRPVDRDRPAGDPESLLPRSAGPLDMATTK